MIFLVIRVIFHLALLFVILQLIRDIIENKAAARDENAALIKIHKEAGRLVNIVGHKELHHLKSDINTFTRKPSVDVRNTIMNRVASWIFRLSESGDETMFVINSLSKSLDDWTLGKLRSILQPYVIETPRPHDQSNNALFC